MLSPNRSRSRTPSATQSEAEAAAPISSPSLRARSRTLSSAQPESELHTGLFKEKLQLSEKLINRFVKQPFADANAIKKSSKRGQGRKQMTITDAVVLVQGRNRQRDIESEQLDANANFNLFQVDQKSDTEAATNSSQLSKKLRQNLPEFSSLHLKVESSNGTINMAHANLGDERCIIFSHALNDSTDNPHAKKGKGVQLSIDDEAYSVYSLSLCDNRITDRGMQVIMHNLISARRLHNLRHLDVSDNKIGKEGAMALAKCVCQLSELQRLNISNMNLCDGVLHDMFVLLSSSDIIDEHAESKSTCDDDHKPFLRSLMLSKNQLSTYGAKALADYLNSPTGSEILELDISWNILGVEGASQLWKVLTNHEYLISLDVSWNSLGDHNHEEMAEQLHAPTAVNPLTTAVREGGGGGGGGGPGDVGDSPTIQMKEVSRDKPPDFDVVPVHGTLRQAKVAKYESAVALANLLNLNDTLLHLNIAHNSLCAKECEIIGEGLLENHTLMGLHVTGWKGYPQVQNDITYF
jgi:hypothetical protein